MTTSGLGRSEEMGSWVKIGVLSKGKNTATSTLGGLMLSPYSGPGLQSDPRVALTRSIPVSSLKSFLDPSKEDER